MRVKNSIKEVTKISDALNRSKDHVRIMDPGIRPLTVEDFRRMKARREELKSELLGIQALMNASAAQVKQHKLKATVIPALSRPKSAAAARPKSVAAAGPKTTASSKTKISVTLPPISPPQKQVKSSSSKQT